jgi:hypothetical protein
MKFLQLDSKSKILEHVFKTKSTTLKKEEEEEGVGPSQFSRTHL